MAFDCSTEGTQRQVDPWGLVAYLVSPMPARLRTLEEHHLKLTLGLHRSKYLVYPNSQNVLGEVQVPNKGFEQGLLIVQITLYTQLSTYLPAQIQISSNLPSSERLIQGQPELHRECLYLMKRK